MTLTFSRKVPPVGLENDTCAGCYINAVVQSLAALPSFLDTLLTQPAPNAFTAHLQNLFVDLSRTTFRNVNMRYFMREVVPVAGDPLEFLLKVLDELSPLAGNVFLHELHYHGACPCGAAVDLPVRQEFVFAQHAPGRTVQDLVDGALHAPQRCPRCARDVACAVDVHRVPRVLCVFVQNTAVGEHGVYKIRDSVPLTRALAVAGATFYLMSATTHVGDATEGHCRAIVDTPEGWFVADDTNVYKADGSPRAPLTRRRRPGRVRGRDGPLLPPRGRLRPDALPRREGRRPAVRGVSRGAKVNAIRG